MGEVIVITSGKGGVGKTTTTANLGSALALEGKKVVLVDTDIGLRNLDVVMGLENRIVYDIVDVVEEKCKLKQALIKDKRFEELFLLPAAQTRDKSAVNEEQMRELTKKLKEEFDYIIIDCPAGIEQGFKNAIAGADRALVVTTPEVSAIRDADRIIGLLEANDFSKIDFDLMFEYLNEICIKENLSIDSDALKEIVKLSDGCLRDSLSFLDQISKYNCNIDINLIESNFGVLSKTKLSNLYNFVMNNEKEKVNDIINEISCSGFTPINFINDFIDYLLKLIIKDEINNQNEIVFIKEIIKKLNNLLVDFNSNINLYTLIIVELITLNYFPGNNLVNISQEKQDLFIQNNKTNEKKNDIVENNTIKQQNKNIKFDENLKSIRINNAFVNPSKELKNNFSVIWNDFIHFLNENNEYRILGFVENSNIEVVSEYSVIVSFESNNQVIIFNQNLDEIENIFFKFSNNNIKFVGLSNSEWLEERKSYVNNKNKMYNFIDENYIKTNEIIKTKDIAEDIFGKEIIELK